MRDFVCMSPSTPNAAPRACPRRSLCAPVAPARAAAWALCGRRGCGRVWLGVACAGALRAPLRARTHALSRTRAHARFAGGANNVDEDGVSSKDKKIAWRIVADLDNLTTGMNAGFYTPLLLAHTPQYLVDNYSYIKSFLGRVSLAFLISAITKLQKRLKDSSGGLTLSQEHPSRTFEMS